MAIVERLKDFFGITGESAPVPKCDKGIDPMIRTRDGHDISGIDDCTHSTDGRYIVTGFHVAMVWSVATGKVVRWYTRLYDRTVVAISADSKWVLYGGTSRSHKESLVVQELEDPLPRHVDEWPTTRRVFGEGILGRVTFATFTPDGRSILCLCHDNPKDENSARMYLFQIDEPSMPVFELDLLNIPPWEATVRISPNGEFAVLGKALWNVRTRTQICRLQDVQALAFAPDSSTIAVGGEKAQVRLLDPNTGGEKGRLSSACRGCSCVSFSASGSTVLVGDTRGMIEIWDVQKGNLTRSLAAHRSPVLLAEYSPYDDYMLTCADDGRAYVWNTTDFSKAYFVHTRFRAPWTVRKMAFLPSDGGRLFVANSHGAAIYLLPGVRTRRDA